MTKKIFFVLVFFFFVVALPVHASTILYENFDSYSNGVLPTGWANGSGSNITENSNVNTAPEAFQVNGDAISPIETPTTFGEQQFYIYIPSSGTGSVQVVGNTSSGLTPLIWLDFGNYISGHFANMNVNFSGSNCPGAGCDDLGTITYNTWIPVVIAWTSMASGNTVTYNINNGGFSAGVAANANNPTHTTGYDFVRLFGTNTYPILYDTFSDVYATPLTSAQNFISITSPKNAALVALPYTVSFTGFYNYAGGLGSPVYDKIHFEVYDFNSTPANAVNIGASDVSLTTGTQTFSYSATLTPNHHYTFRAWFFNSTDSTIAPYYSDVISFDTGTTGFASGQLSEVCSGLLDLPCQMHNFTYWLFYDNPDSLSPLWTQLTTTITNVWPIGYITRFIAILSNTTPIEPPAFSYTFGTSVTEHTALSGTISINPFDHLDVINTVVSDVDGKTIWDIFMPYWNTVCYLALFIAIFTKIMNTDFHFPGSRSLPQNESQQSFSRAESEEYRYKEWLWKNRQ